MRVMAPEMALLTAFLLVGLLAQSMTHGAEEFCADLVARTTALNKECCDEESEDCSSGRPATCNIGCARVLLPYFDDCAAVLGVDAAAQFADVVALCRAAELEKPTAPTVVVSYTVGGTPGSPGTNQILTVHADGSSPRQLTHCTLGCVQPNWSPDGSKIVFGEQTQSGMQLRLIAPDGSGLQELTDTPGYINMLALWMNNTHIVWARQQGGGSVHIARCLEAGQRDDIFASQLFVMDTRDRRSMAPLFKAGVRPSNVADTMPSVSPDGKRVAFVTNHTQGAGAGVARVWVADITGANARPISPGRTSVDLQGDGCVTPISQKVPAWSPDGTQIAHWEGIEMNYLAAFSCKPGSHAKCRHDPQRDLLITQGNVALGGDYAGWKVYTVAMDGTEGTAASTKIDQGRGDDPVWSPESRLSRAYPSPQPGWTVPGPLIMLQDSPHGNRWSKLPILPPNTPGWGRYAWKRLSSPEAAPVSSDSMSPSFDGPSCQDKRWGECGVGIVPGYTIACCDGLSCKAAQPGVPPVCVP